MRLIDADLLKSDFKDVMPFDIVEINNVKAGLYRDTIIQQVIDDQPTGRSRQQCQILRCQTRLRQLMKMCHFKAVRI